MLVSIITPTYNRAGTLHRCFESLAAQTFRDFEWIIVDDGSQDDTAALVSRWQAAADFPIRYEYKPNGGKPSAVNLGIRHARGRYASILDSDDGLLPDALAILVEGWQQIPQDRHDRYWVVLGLCRDGQTHETVGDLFPDEPLDCSWGDLHFRLKVGGEKWGLMRSDVLKQHPWPESPEYRFVPEGLIWGRLGRTFRYICLNKVVRDYYRPQGAADGNLSGRANAIRNAAGMVLYEADALNHDLPRHFRDSPAFFLKRCIQFTRFSLHAGKGLASWRSLDSGMARRFVAALLPIGALLYLRDCVWFSRVYARRQSVALDTVS